MTTSSKQMDIHSSIRYLREFIGNLDTDLDLFLSDDRLLIWTFLKQHNAPEKYITLFERTVGTLYSVKLCIYHKQYVSHFTDGSYFFFPEGSKEDVMYRNFIKDGYEIDLMFQKIEHTGYQSDIYFDNIPVIPSPRENRKKLNLGEYGTYSKKEFLDSLHGNHAIFYGNRYASMLGTYNSTQQHIHSLLLIYNYVSGLVDISDIEKNIVIDALQSRILSKQFYLDVVSRAIKFGYSNFTELIDDFNDFNQKTDIDYKKNIGGLDQIDSLTGDVYKIFNREDVPGFLPGHILVAYNTHPEYMEAFIQAKAVVVENTSELSHAAITCREFNIPGALGASGCLLLPKDAKIIINSNQKTIQVCPN